MRVMRFHSLCPLPRLAERSVAKAWWSLVNKSLFSYLANKSLVTYSLLDKLSWVKSDILFTRIDDMSYLQIQHEVKLKTF